MPNEAVGSPLATVPGLAVVRERPGLIDRPGATLGHWSILARRGAFILPVLFSPDATERPALVIRKLRSLA